MLRRFFTKRGHQPNEAFRIIHDMFYDRVYKSAYFITRDPHLAQDAVQETFLKAYNNIGDVDDGEKMGAWLSTIATRTAIDLMRKQTRWNGTPTEDVILETTNSSTNENLVEEAFETIWTKNRISQEIVKLKPDYKEVLLLKYYYELKDEEIANLLNLKVGTVKSRIHRSKKRLRMVLDSDLNMMDSDADTPHQ